MCFVNTCLEYYLSLLSLGILLLTLMVHMSIVKLATQAKQNVTPSRGNKQTLRHTTGQTKLLSKTINQEGS